MQALVLDTIKHNPGICDQDIRDITGLNINSITPRRGELEKKGLVTPAGIKYINGHPNTTWKTT